MIEQIQLINFKAHRNTTMRLGRMSALVGPNSSGKTSVLQALHGIGRLEQGHPQNAFENENDPQYLYRRKEKFFEWNFEGTTNNVPWSFHLRTQEDTNNIPPWQFHLTWVWEGSSYEKIFSPQDTITPRGRDLKKDPAFVSPEMLSMLSRSTYLKLQASRLAEVSYSPDEIPQVASDGRYLASTISYLKTYEEEAFERLQEAIQKVVPHVERLRVKRAKVEIPETRYINVEKLSFPLNETRTFMGDELVFDLKGVGEIPARDVSEGTLLAVGLLTVLVSPSCPNLILLDDVEQGLHPKAQRELVHVLKEILNERKDLQMVMTTHSPYIVDEMEASMVHVMALNQEGAVLTRLLDEHPNAKKALEVLTTGEFLSAEGEEWVLEGQRETTP